MNSLELIVKYRKLNERNRMSSSNDQFKYIEQKYLVGKSNQNNDDFDIVCAR